MFNRIKTLIQRWNEVRAVSAFSDRDLADLGLSRAQLEAFVRMPDDVPDRVLAMAATFGLSETEVKANLWGMAGASGKLWRLPGPRGLRACAGAGRAVAALRLRFLPERRVFCREISGCLISPATLGGFPLRSG